MRERVAEYHEDSARFVGADRVVRAAASGNDLESLHVAREDLAREAAGIFFTRLQAVPGSRELGRLASRRIAALREIANVTLAIARADQTTPSPARMSRILESLAGVVNEAAAAVLPEDVAK